MEVNHNNNDGDDVMLSIAVIHEVLDYIHIDLKQIVHKEGDTLFDNADNRLPLSLIMSSGLEEYFKHVLLDKRFKTRLCGKCEKRGQLELLKWKTSKGCPWNPCYNTLYEGTCSAAAAGGHLACLIWAREHGCPWDLYTCSHAAGGGHLACLIWAREHGCLWDSNTCSVAAKEGHLACLKWAREHGCPWNILECRNAAARSTMKKGNKECLQWINEHKSC